MMNFAFMDMSNDGFVLKFAIASLAVILATATPERGGAVTMAPEKIPDDICTLTPDNYASKKIHNFDFFSGFYFHSEPTEREKQQQGALTKLIKEQAYQKWNEHCGQMA